MTEPRNTGTAQPLLDNIPTELREAGAWMGTRMRRKQNGKVDKPPYRVRRGLPVIPGSKTNPEHQASFAEALEAARRSQVDHIGRVFTADDPYTVVDLDECRDPLTG